jgi:GNAT superfamily N-acetyltransferase
MTEPAIESAAAWRYQVGSLCVELVPLPDACWAIRQWQGVAAGSAFEQQALIKALVQTLHQGDTTLMVDSHRSAAILRWLLDHGFTPRRCKYIYEKMAPSSPSTAPGAISFSPLVWKSLAALGEQTFLRYLVAAATDDPEGSAATNPEQEFQELLDHAGEAFNPNQWFVAFDPAHAAHPTDRAIGIVLPQQFADKPSEGTLSYIGVMPEFRQQGYGVRLHQRGLELLFSWGVQRYIGSTGQSNLAMQRVFAKNQCTLLGKRYFLTCEPVERA